MGIRQSAQKITVTLVWNYTNLDQLIIKDVKRTFSKFGYCNIEQDSSDPYKNRVSGRILLTEYNHNHKSRLESIPRDHGGTDAILYVVNPETDMY